MAKKKVIKEGELPDPFEMMKAIDENVEIIADSEYSNIKEWVPTGNYLLNACISGSLFGGIPSGRVSTLVGESGAGKTYLACSICREAQSLGYNILYLDSEGAMDSNFFTRLGCDAKKIMIKQVNTITEVSQLVANLCKTLEEQDESYGKHNKFMIVLDSLGNLTSEKERDDTMTGNQKRDMTKQQEIKAMFRVNATPVARMQIPWIVVSHVYASMSMFSPGNVVSGGSGIQYNSSVTLELFKSKLDDKENNSAAEKTANKDDVIKTGVTVTAKPQKSRFTIARKVRFQIPFFKKPNPFVGLEAYLNWSNSGVCRGNMLTEKEFEKLGGESDKVHSFELNGEKMYCQEKDTARGIVVKHLGKQVNFVEFFSPTVFTDDFLHQIDESIIKPAFELPNQSSFDDISEIEDIVNVGDTNVE